LIRTITVEVSTETVDSRSIKKALTHMNLADRIEEMKRRQQSKRNVASADVDQANIVKGKRSNLQAVNTSNPTMLN
jgi:hypothetical protein